MKKPFIFLILFLICFSFLSGYQLTLVSEDESNRIASNWVSYINKIPLKGKLGKYEIKFIEEINFKGNLLCEVYHLNPQGYILVTSYKEFPPIKSFSVISDFDSESEGYEFVVLEELKIGFKYLKKNEGEEKVKRVLIKNRSRWRKLIKLNLKKMSMDIIQLEEDEKGTKKFILRGKEKKLKFESIQAPPLLNTEWNQGSPYWNKCPSLGGERCYVGCVATAMAQIMRYYKYPKRGEGSHSYFWWNGNKWLSANFSDSYDWDYMPNKTHQYDTYREKDAVSELCYEAGVSLEMKYGTDGSSAYTSDVAEALKNYFKYSSRIKVVYRRDYSGVNAWFSNFKNQRDQSRPVEFSIRSEDSGHAVVVDGYLIAGTSKKIHINMGWGGHSDDYYTLDNILDYTDTHSQYAVIDIIPQEKYRLSIEAGTGGTTEPSPGTYSYLGGTEVTVKAFPAEHYIFDFWSGCVSSTENSVTINMYSDKTLKANFQLVQPPSHFSGEKVLNRSLYQAEYINELSWEANPANQGINISHYRIYEVTGNVRTLLVELSADTFEYMHRDVEKDKQYKYAVVAVTTGGTEGQSSYTTIN